MNKPTKLKPSRPNRKEENQSKQKIQPTSPSMSADHNPVSENDNSANLFEDHIQKIKKDEEC